MEKIIEKAKELGELLEQSELVKKQKEAKKAFDSDEELQTLISEFNLAKMALTNESKKDKPDSQLLEKYRGQTTSAYEKIMQHPVMIKLNNAEMAMENLFQQINQILQESVSDNEGGCTHNCATCSGCH